jgi:hypothetical protein
VRPGSQLANSLTNAKAPINDRMCSLMVPTICVECPGQPHGALDGASGVSRGLRTRGGCAP